MAADTVQSNPTLADDPRAARLAILAAARQVHRRVGAVAVTFAAVAKEAGKTLEAVAAHFQNPQEILLALAADDLSSVARAMQDEAKDAPAKTEAAAKPETPAPPVTVRKKTVMPAPLEQVMRDVAPDQGKEVITGAVARLERRIQVLEKAFTDIVDRHEKSLRERGGAVTSVEESVSAILARMDAAEKDGAGAMGELKSLVAHMGVRLDAMEQAKGIASQAVPVQPFLFDPPPTNLAPMLVPMTAGEASVQSWLSPAPVEAVATGEATPAHDALPAMKPEDKMDSGPVPAIGMPTLGMPTLGMIVAGPQETLAQAEGAAKPDRKESYLTAARRAALAAAEKNEPPKPAPLDNARTRFGNRTKFLAFAFLAPVVILGTAIVVLNRNAVTASAVQETQQTAAEPVATEIVASIPPSEPVAQPQDNAPLQTASVNGAPEIVSTPPVNPTPEQLKAQTSLATLTQTAQAGDVRSMRDVALKYLAGDGVDVNESEAARWLMRAAYKGEPVSEYWLATLYARGKGVPTDAFQANHWYEAAAKQGNRRAMHALAIANFEGLGVEKNFVEAARWFKASAELGLVDSQFNLAVLYERGAGVAQNVTEAYKWYAVAATQGDKEAENRIAVLASQMNAGELAMAQADAAAFKPKPMNQAANFTTAPGQNSGG